MSRFGPSRELGRGEVKMKVPGKHPWDGDVTLVAQVAACISFLSFFYYVRHNDLLLYGDVFGHINIARRVFDSRTPGPLQLGTVWLPLPHVLILPFIVSDWMWQTGIGGSIPSLFAYIFGVAGIFRLVRGVLSFSNDSRTARHCAWLAAAIYGANPNLIYMQATAMTEASYLALAIWAVVYFVTYVHNTGSRDASSSPSSALTKCGLCLCAASFTRYDGWFLSGILSVAVLAIVIYQRTSLRILRGDAGKFLLLAAAAPVLWLAYNTVVYKNALEFANGPYSAQGLAHKDAAAGTSPYPGARDLPTAFSFFLKSSELNLADGDWGRLWIAAALAGTFAIAMKRRLWPLFLLAVPIPFYILSIAYSGVPIYLPVWWPHGYYNVRYGLELLPAIAVFIALGAHQMCSAVGSPRARIAIPAIAIAVVACSYAAVWRTQPICFREALANSRTRIAIEGALAENLKKLPPDSSLLMYLGDHVGALQRARIPLRRAISENNHRPWKKPYDPAGLWELALANPAFYADYVVAVDGDAVARDVNREQLRSLVVIHVAGEPAATIYRTLRGGPAH